MGDRIASILLFPVVLSILGPNWLYSWIMREHEFREATGDIIKFWFKRAFKGQTP